MNGFNFESLTSTGFTPLFFTEFHIILYRSIALKVIYKKSFECDSIRVTFWSIFEFESVKSINVNVSNSKSLAFIKFYSLKF
jgi:hypothetical protein